MERKFHAECPVEPVAGILERHRVGEESQRHRNPTGAGRAINRFENPTVREALEARCFLNRADYWGGNVAILQVQLD